MAEGCGHLFLIGFMGSGKTTVGRRLAESVGWELADTDSRVVAREGRSIEEIFAAAGEARFRAVEREVLRDLGGTPRCIVAAGGGLFAAHANRQWMRRHGRTVWLDLPLEAVRRRLGRGSGRPLWTDGSPLELRRLFERRRAVYALADLAVDASGAPGSVAERVRKRLGPFFD